MPTETLDAHRHPTEFDFFDPAILVEPADFYRRTAEQFAVARIPGRPVYGVFSADLITEALRRTEDFSNDFADAIGINPSLDPVLAEAFARGWPFARTLVFTDAPDHTYFRKLVNKAFAKPRVDAIAHRIEYWTNHLIDQFESQGHCDFVNDFCVKLPVHVIAEQLGLGDVEPDRVKQFADAFTDLFGGLIDPARRREVAQIVVDFQHLIMEQAAKRRVSPQDDLLSDLVSAASEDGRQLTDAELLSLVQQLASAGSESTSSALSTAMLWLAPDPAMQRSFQDPGLRFAFIEEILRLSSPAAGIWRIVKQATTLGDYYLPAGALVSFRLDAANRNPDLYPDPDKLDLSRRNVQAHFAFGKGIHTCVGNMLARKEIEIGLETIFRRLKNIHILPGQTIEYVPNMSVRALKSLEISFDRP